MQRRDRRIADQVIGVAHAADHLVIHQLRRDTHESRIGNRLLNCREIACLAQRRHRIAEGHVDAPSSLRGPSSRNTTKVPEEVAIGLALSPWCAEARTKATCRVTL